jgi:hypothetical protein|tara:strand:- start:4090 stop:4455 length:366 start_codon:yes stop_codon:yes gene_type:complete
MSIFWAKFLLCCKKQWKLIAGFITGFFAILLIIKRGPSKKMFEKKSELQDKTSESESIAREKLDAEYQKNLDAFLDKNDQIEEETRHKLKSLDDEKKDRVKELLSSSNPENEIAKALKKLL